MIEVFQQCKSIASVIKLYLDYSFKEYSCVYRRQGRAWCTTPAVPLTSLPDLPCVVIMIPWIM